MIKGVGKNWGGRTQGVFALLAIVLAFGSQGCLTMPVAGITTLTTHFRGGHPVAEPVHQVHSRWQGYVVSTPDAANQGVPLLGLAGRVYLFGADLKHAVVGNGEIIVDLFDSNRMGEDGQPLRMERWKFDPETLKKLCRQDIVGWGYTLFLPWASYHPGIKHIQLQVIYIPKQGTPLYGIRTPVTLRGNDAHPAVHQRTAPAALPAPVTPGQPPTELPAPRQTAPQSPQQAPQTLQTPQTSQTPPIQSSMRQLMRQMPNTQRTAASVSQAPRVPVPVQGQQQTAALLMQNLADAEQPAPSYAALPQPPP